MRLFPIIVAVGVLAACSDSSGPKAGPPTALLITAGGTAQTGTFGQAAPIAPTVLVTDANNRPVPDIVVNFTVAAGGGAVSAASQTTGSNGAASVIWTLGNTFGTKTLTASVQGLTPVTFTASAIAPDAGVPAFNLVDPVGDTIANPEGASPRAHDVVGLRGDFKRDSLIVTVTFNSPISPGSISENAIGGFLEFDIDDSRLSGIGPVSNAFGATADLGIEYQLDMFDSDGTTLFLYSLTAEAPVKASFTGNSVVVRIPMSLLASDDGNFAIVGVIGNTIRPTDLLPNAGQTLARRGTISGSLGMSAESRTLLNSAPILKTWGQEKGFMKTRTR